MTREHVERDLQAMESRQQHEAIHASFSVAVMENGITREIYYGLAGFFTRLIRDPSVISWSIGLVRFHSHRGSLLRIFFTK